MLRFLTFVYDFGRFIFLVAILQAAGRYERTIDAFFFPLFAYAAPFALFPAMTFFLWINPEKYKSYEHLYSAGKIIFSCAVIAAFVFSLKSILPVVQFWTQKKLLVNLVFPFMVILDIVSVLIIIKTSAGLRSQQADGAIPEIGDEGQTLPPRV
jgi:hypothetical protein